MISSSSRMHQSSHNVHGDPVTGALSEEQKSMSNTGGSGTYGGKYSNKDSSVKQGMLSMIYEGDRTSQESR